MGVAKRQKEKIEKTCQCGCGESFYPFPVYGKKGDGLIYPIYKRGHHPNCRKKKPAWNKGLTKEICPTISRMGFQPGHAPHNDWSKVNERLKTDATFRQKWLESKQNQVPWNINKKKCDYPNGFKSGASHGNWCGNKRGVHDLAVMKAFSKSIMERDNYTCQHCGDHNYKGRGARIRLEVHHIVAISENHELALVPSNAITLCSLCHRKTDNFGTKAAHKRKNQGR